MLLSCHIIFFQVLLFNSSCELSIPFQSDIFYLKFHLLNMILQTKVDFTMMGGMLLCVLVVFMLFGLVAIFLPQSRWLSKLFC